MVELVLCTRILKNLQSPEIRSFRGLEKRLTDLEMVVNKIKERLRHAEEKREDGCVFRWLKEVCGHLFEADDLVEKLAYEAIHKRAMSGNQVQQLVRLFISPFNQIAFGAKMAKVIQKVEGNLNRLIGESNEFGFSIRPIEEEDQLWESDPSMPLDQTPMGGDEDKQALVDMLLDSPVQDDVEFVGIVGLGGVGKTTLAQLVDNDAKVKAHFELRMWVSVGLGFNIASRIIQSASTETPSLDLETLRSQVGNAINGKLYLLVLDDVWEESREKWLELRDLLNGGARGSKILLTTRSKMVGKHLDKIYDLRGLSHDDSWSLFQQLAFKQTPEDLEFITIGREIVEKCGNVPLVIRVLGSLLRGQRKEKWRSILNQISSSNMIMDALNLAYDNLPANLKACFSFLCIFPRNYELNKCDLISLWMAQGFIEPQQNQSVGHVGEEYFEALLKRSFFTDVKRDELGNISTCKMHELVHDPTLKTACSHIGTTLANKLTIRAPKMRTFLQLQQHAAAFVTKPAVLMCDKLVPNLRCLRALDLHDCGIEELPGSITKLLSLRYLDLSNNSCLTELPESITRLYYLQTLKLNFCEKLKRLPKGIGRLVDLTRLEIDDCDSLTAIPLGLERLTCLETLSRFIVGRDGSDPNRSCGLRALSPLNNLKGRLTIELCGELRNVLEEAAAENLSSKSKLSELKIGWGLKRLDGVNPSQYQALLEGIKPLFNLTVLDIDGCKECQHLPELGRLPFLKRLTLRHMDGVQYVESSGGPAPAIFFPFLEELTLQSFYNLEGWWNPVREVEQQVGEVEQQPFPFFPCLLKLRIWNCPKLIDMPLFPWVEDLDLLNVNQKLLQDSRASSATIDATSSITCRSFSFVNRFRELPHLKRLQMKRCPNLKSFPALGVSAESNGFSSLKYLVVDNCNELRSAAEGLQHFSSLEELEISGCKVLDFSERDQDEGMPWKCLSRLRYLTFHGIPKMQKLPDGLKHVSTLRFLCISSCNNLACLPEWMSCLTSLVHLRIECCPTLKKLPHSLKDMHSLVKVEITECPELVERCREHTGVEWHKIKHARVLLHKSWRYGLLSDEGHSQPRQQNHRRVTGGTCNNVVRGDNAIAQFKDVVVHVTGATVTISKLQCNTNDTKSDGN